MTLIARSILECAAAGQAIPVSLLDSLAIAILDAPTVRLAKAVIAGGSHKLTRAIELAQQLAQRAQEASPLHSFHAQPSPKSSPSSPSDDSSSEMDGDDACDDAVMTVTIAAGK